jgi:hypothetical protein
LNTADGDFDERDWDAFTFKRTGKQFAKKPPCKFHPLGTCTKGKACKFSHSSFKDPRNHAAVAQEEGDPDAYWEEEAEAPPAVPTEEPQTAEIAAAAKAKGKGRKGKGKGKGKGKKGKGKKGNY